MLRFPSTTKTKQREILLLYGHHAVLERWWGLVENLGIYGNVTMPDLPGFGGMDSFYKIGIKPDIDAYADYLASFVKLRFRRKKITIVAVSYGFVVVTRMLQRYPELTKKVDLLVSIVGFVHREDFVYTPFQRRFFRRGTRFFGARPMPFLIKHFGLNKIVLKTFYVRLPNSKRRMIEITPEEFQASMEFEYVIWNKNDVRTHWVTTSQFFTLDNCQKKVNLPVIHVTSKEDHYFDNEMVKQHMLVTFTKYRRFVANTKAHTPSILADKAVMGVLLPPGLRRILAKP
jgi:pimeloyl-ACP methyl ester carboxylesterase